MSCSSSTGTVKIGAMAKGSGMIHPNMATMLVYVTTDAKADPADLQKMLSAAVDKSFNMVHRRRRHLHERLDLPARQRRFRR